jgi:hypothetical protein
MMAIDRSTFPQDRKLSNRQSARRERRVTSAPIAPTGWLEPIAETFKIHPSGHAGPGFSSYAQLLVRNIPAVTSLRCHCNRNSIDREPGTGRARDNV